MWFSGNSSRNNADFLDVIEPYLRAHVPGPINFDDYAVTTPRSDEKKHLESEAEAETFRRRYATTKFDLVIAHSPPALEFALHYRDKIFPGVPIVFTAVATTEFAGKTWPNVTGLEVPVGLRETIDLALRLHPDTTTVAVIWGGDTIWAAFTHTELLRYKDRLREVSFPGDASREMLEKITALPPHTIVLFQLAPSEGPAFGAMDLLDAVAQRLPTYSPWPNLCLNHGCVGGAYEDVTKNWLETAKIAAQVLSGQRPENIPIVRSSHLNVTLDWRALQRWGIKESSLPPGSVILYREPTLWERGQKYFLAGIAIIVLQALAIFGLFWQRARKRRIEAELRRSEERFSKSFRQSPIAITIASVSDGRYIEVNETFERQTGWRREEVIGRSPLDIDLWLDPNQRSLFIKRLLVEGNVREFEVRLRRKDGEIRTALGSAELIEVNGEPCTLSLIADITERKQAEEALRSSEAQLREAEHIAHVGHSIWDVETDTTIWSEEMYRITGRNPQLGPPKQQERRTLYTPESWARLELAIKRALQSQEPYDLEVQIVRPGAELRWARLRGVALGNAAGRVAQLRGTLEDITDRKEAERAVRDSQARLQGIFDSTQDAMITVDQQQRILAFNPSAEEMFGYKSSDLIGQSLERLLPEAARSSHARFVEAFGKSAVSKRTMQARELELSCLRSDGQIFPTEVSISHVEVAGQKLFTAFVRDITQRKQAEHAIRKAEERYRTIFEQAVDGILQVTPEGQLLAANPALARIFGYGSPAELMNAVSNMRQIWRHPEQRQDMLLTIEEKGVVTGYELEILRADGQPIWVSVSERKISGPDGKTLYFEGFVEDITQRKQLEHQLLHSQKMEAVGRLAGGIAHDFNNALGIITGYTELALRDTSLDESTQRRLTEIQNAANRAVEITRQLLAFSRKQVLQAQVLDLNAVVRDSAAMLSRLLGEDVELVTSLASELGTVEIDSTALHQIIMNLAVNARDAMPDGGRLTIETSSVFFDESYRETHSDVQPGDYVMLAVTDTGTGMDAETQKRIFEPFFTTKEIGRGTGLGLSTVYGIVQQSRGHIWVYSELGVGTAFKIYFPQTGLAAPENVVRREQEIPRGSETILLVEDDSGLRKLNATLLQDLGYHVLQSSNGTEAIKMAAGHTGSLHLLLTDVVMPGMNGKQLATRLIEARPDLKVLFVSGHTDTVTGRELLSGSAAFLQKPLTRAVLANKLRELLDAKIQS